MASLSIFSCVLALVNLSLRGRFPNISELDERVYEVVSGNDLLGVEAVQARLFGEGVVVFVEV